MIEDEWTGRDLQLLNDVIKKDIPVVCGEMSKDGTKDNCPAYGTKMDDSCDFCPHCGTIVKKNPDADEPQEKIDETRMKRGQQ